MFHATQKALLFGLTMLTGCQTEAQNIPLVEPQPIVEADARPRAKARHILVAYEGATRAAPTLRRSKESSRERIGEIQQQLEANADFAALAKLYSDDPVAKADGGLGVVLRGQMDAPFEEALFALRINERSEIVETQYGFHIIERRPLKEVKLLHLLIQWKGLPGSTTTRSKTEAQALARELSTELKGAEQSTVSAAIVEHSDGALAKWGGDLGWFEYTELHSDFADIIFALPKQTLSAPVLGEQGVHLFYRYQ